MERGRDGDGDGEDAKVLDGVDGGGKTVLEDEAWQPTAEFVHEPPVLEVTQPKGSFCQIDARFSVALDPEGVYNIITDPNNRRVFKNIKVRCSPIIFTAILSLVSGKRKIPVLAIFL